MKKAISITLLLVLCFSLFACGSVDVDTVDRQLQGEWTMLNDDGTKIASYYFIDGRVACKIWLTETIALDAKLGSYKITNNAIVLHYDEADTEAKLKYRFNDGTLKFVGVDMEKAY